MHNGFLKINNEKMSKSLGNFFTVREIGEKYDLQVIRFFMLSAHYRSPLNFSADLVEASKNGLERIRTAAGRLAEYAEKNSNLDLTEKERQEAEQLASYQEKFNAAMDDDLNTADAISVIFELVKYANTAVTEESSRAFAAQVLAELKQLSDVLGIVVEKKEELLDSDIEALIAERQAARKSRDFARADEIRNQLLEKGILLEDTREGVRWKRA
jgi:cysteinyl-tRNA synthetase